MSSSRIYDLNFSGKSNKAEVIDLSATDYVNAVPFSIIIGTTAGAIKVDMAGGGTVTIAAPIGYQPLLVTKVYKIGTAAVGLTAIWSI